MSDFQHFIPQLDAASTAQCISMQDTVSVPIQDAIPHQPTVYRKYKARYIDLFVIVALNIATGFVWLTYFAVPAQSSIFLNSTGSILSLTSILHFIAYVLMAPISGWVCEHHGIKKSLIFGASLQLVGSWLRFFATLIDSTPDKPEGRLELTLIGQVIAATAQPFLGSVSPKYAVVWFSERTRHSKR